MSSIDALLYSRAAASLAWAPAARAGYHRYLVTGRTPTPAYRALRKLYGAPSPAAFERLVGAAAREHPALGLSVDAPGVAAGAVEELVERLRNDGLARLPGRLDEATCAALEETARAATCTLVDRVDPASPDRAVFDPEDPAAVRADVDESDIVADPVAQALLADESLLAVAERYLGAAPVQDLVAMWWSAAVGGRASSAAAQQYHFDLDRLRFVKFFAFLTDVDERTGPHVFVVGSHRTKPAHLRRDGRHADAVVEAAFPGAAEVVTGSRGTMFLADTIGLHKGLELSEAHRLVFQMEWSTSLFGAPFTEPQIVDPVPVLIGAARRHPDIYSRFRLGLNGR